MTPTTPRRRGNLGRPLLLTAVAVVVAVMFVSPALGTLSRGASAAPSPTVQAGSATPSSTQDVRMAPTGSTLGESSGVPVADTPGSSNHFSLAPMRGTPTPAANAHMPHSGVNGAIPIGHRSGTGSLTSTLAPAVPRATPDVPVRLGVGWNGINLTWASCGCAPPDVEIAVGTTYLVEMTNLEEAVYSKTGTLVASQSLASFFVAPSSTLSDPRILYDNLSGRWFASILNVSGNDIFFGVSTGPDPTGTWHLIKALPGNGTNELPDQPFIGVSSTMLAVTANGFNLTSGFEDGTQWSVLNKTEMLAGSGVFYHTWGPVGWDSNGRAVDALTPTNVAMFQFINPSNYYDTYVVTGVPPATPTYSYVYQLLATTVAAPPPAPQPGTAYTLDDSDARIVSAVWQEGIVTTALSDACGSSSCARITQAYTSNGTVIQDYDWGLAWNILYPAATVDASGNILLVLGVGNAGLYGSVAVAAILHNEPGYAKGYFVKYGSAAWTSSFACNGLNVCRYGDYFGAAKDPTSAAVWTAGEYLNTTPLWSTFIEAAYAAPLAVSVPVATPGPVDVGVATNLTTSGATGGSGGPYTYAWSGLPPGCSSANVLTLLCTPTGPGTFTVTVQATDPQSRTATARVTLTVNPLPTLAVPTASAAAADVGVTLTFTSAVPAGGTPVFTYVWAGLPAGCGAGTTAAVTCTFAAAGALTVMVTATDLFGKAAVSPPLAYTVSAAPTLGAPAASTPAADAGQTVTFTSAAAGGGTPGFTYLWTGLPPGCGPATTIAVTCTFTAAASLSLHATATDTVGGTVTSPALAYTVSPALVVGTPTVSSDSVTTGTTITFTAVASGGSGGDQYVWSGLPSGCASANAASVTCTLNDAGTISVTVTVTDSNGAHVTSAAVTATATSPTGLFGLPGVTGWIVLALIVVAIAGLIAVLMTRRRRKPGLQPYTGPQPSTTPPSGAMGGAPPPPPTE